MKKALIMLLTFAAMFVISCSSDETTQPQIDTNKYGIISGKVFDINGYALKDVTVKVKDKITKTNEQGWFYLDKVVVEASESVVTFEKNTDSTNFTAYLPTLKRVRVLENTDTHLPDTKLLEAITRDFNSTDSLTIDLNVGSMDVGTVNIDADVFVTSSGSRYRGNVHVEVNGYLPTNPNFYDVFPGGFNGQDSSGTGVQLISLGYMTINATDGNRNKLQIAPGKTIGLKLKATAKFRDLDTVPMWYLDETTGIWKEEGLSTRTTDNYFAAEVPHLSSWNWDVVVNQNDICIISGKVVRDDSSLVPNAIVRGEGIGGELYYDQTYTDSEGRYSMRALKNSTIVLVATIGTSASPYDSLSIGNNSTQPMPDIIVSVPLFSTILQWGKDPEDLDSHLIIPKESLGYNGHVYYGNLGEVTQYPFALLDTDDMHSYGPEIITAFKLLPGTYKYFVRHYSGDSTLAQSQAKVIVNLRGASNSFSVPTTSHTPPYTYWHVFNVVVANNGNATLQAINTLVPDSVFSNALNNKKFTFPAKK